mmetsp:Transcript_9749/g.20405  ORF Transcript_9749/g.20405 Transcript_9749/m.20405 type:complete len:265 (+) Transcript_9749:199-993(+)
MSFSSNLLVAVLAIAISIGLSSGFSEQRQWQRKERTTTNTRLHETTANNNSGEASAGESLKRELLQLAASYDRGYGATRRARNQAESLISNLEAINEEQNAARGIDGNGPSPLTGNWRMVWTTAADVLTLSANPLVTVGAIYQVFDLPSVTNVIDFLPPFQTLVGNQLGSLLRAKVQTRAYLGKDDKDGGDTNRIGLEFQSVALEPVELLGNDVGFLPPLGFDLPRTPFEGYFDVAYVDEDLLIIRQNAPGGLFVLAKVDNFDP